MSKCMTIDEAIDQKDTFSEVIPKDIVDSVLEEILVSVLAISDKGCNRIGDFNINEDFCQRYNQPVLVKDFEQANVNQTSSTSNLFSGKNKERPGNGNENTEAELLGNAEEKDKPAGECKVISEEILADNELQIQNGQIHLERIKSSLESAREEYYKKEDVIKDEKIEIEYYNQGKLNKIYVSLNEPSKELSLQSPNDPKCEDEKEKESENENSNKDSESTFKPFTTEYLRQVWGNGNSTAVGKWDGDVAGQREDVAKLMEGLSSIQVFPDGSADPNRPRTCSVVENDVKKMIKEIEEINFTQSQDTLEDYPPDGQGDADLESKSFTKSKDILNKSRTESGLSTDNSCDDIKKSQEEEVYSTEIRQDQLSESVLPKIREPPTDSVFKTDESSPPGQTIRIYNEKSQIEENIPSVQDGIESNVASELSVTEKLSLYEKFVSDVQFGNAEFEETGKENPEFSMTSSNDFHESDNQLLPAKVESSLCGNDIFSEFAFYSETDNMLSATESSITQTLAEPSDALKHLSQVESEEVKSTHSSFLKVTEYPSDGRLKPNNDNIENAEAEQELMEVQSQGGEKSSQSVKASPDTIIESKISRILRSDESLTNSESGLQEGNTENSEPGTFKLHSEKMYNKMGHDPARFKKNKIVLSKSEEDLIESAESVLQVLEPDGNDQDEPSPSVTFSPPSQEIAETFKKPREGGSKPDVDANNCELPSDDILPKKMYSGMTTIGPIKNTDYDPRDLTGPDIDFGKMTRITSSRQLAKDLLGTDLLGTDLTTSAGVKILEEDDADESITGSDSNFLDSSSLINRDIASLTKVQRVREVMSYQPKLEEDFEDEEALPKPRLDLKDVESTPYERFKVPEAGIPLLSFQVTSETIGTDAETEKQLIKSMALIISGLTEPYYDDMEGNSEDEEKDVRLTESVTENAEENLGNSEAREESQSVHEVKEENIEKEIDVPLNPPELTGGSESKYSTLSGVIRKASSRFMKKDSDTSVRNSKSLPRDANNITTTESIRSILDDCSTSASNVLKKSRSMLRNTQSLFKTISQSRMSNDNGLEKQKMSPSESNVSTVERKLSFLKKEDFAKAKNLIKSNLDTAFRKQENSSELDTEKPEMLEEKKQLQLVIRNEEKLRVDRMENFQRGLSKDYVHKSQFVKDDVSEADAGGEEGDDDDTIVRSDSIAAADVNAVTIQEIANEIEVTSYEEQNEEEKDPAIEEDLTVSQEETSQNYIVMETIQGLPTSDLESPSSEKENLNTNKTSQEYEKGNVSEVNTTDPQAVKENELDIVPESAVGEEAKAVSRIPKKAKKKKFSARLRNFWCSAFGRVKTPTKKCDIS